MRLKVTVFLTFFLLGASLTVQGQDTVKVSLEEFISRGVKTSYQIEAGQQEVRMAENKIKQVQDKRYLPKFTLRTGHGVVPQAENAASNSEGAFFDDLSNLTLYTQATINMVQPVFTWGALESAVEASRAAAEAATNKFDITQNKLTLRLYKLYQSYLFSLEINYILDQAQQKLKKIINKFEEASKKEGSELDESDLYKLKVFKSEFAVKAGKVRASANYIQNVWNFVLGQQGSGVVYMPDSYFIDPVENAIKTVAYYKNRAVQQRPEVLALEDGVDAAQYALEAQKSKRYPMLYVGLTGTYTYTPNPPLGSYAFRFGERHFATVALGIGFRQNLDFWSMKFDVTKSKIRYKKIRYQKKAAMQGIALQVMKKYKGATVAQIKVEKLFDALSMAKRWLRQEQLDYDLGMGNTKDLIDALKKKFKLRVQYKQAIFDFNVNMAELYRVSAIPIMQLSTNIQKDE